MSRKGFELTMQSFNKRTLFICSTYWATQATDRQLIIIAVYRSIVL